MQTPVRVIQCGVGYIGSSIVRLMLEKPQLQVVGAVDTDEAKVGRDLGRVVNLSRDLGIPVSRSIASAAKLSAADVVIMCTSGRLAEIMPELRECIAAGLPVISTCEELAYPYRTHPELAVELDRLAREAGVAVLGAGVNPGFAMDKLVITMAAACHNVSRVRVRRVVDASRRRLALQRRVGAGLDAERFRRNAEAGEIAIPGLVESVAMLADALGIKADRIDETVEPIMALERVRSQFLEVTPGQVRGIRQITRGLEGDFENIRLELEIYIGAPESVDEIFITGKPDLFMSVPGGIPGDLATAAIAVNTIPAVLTAEPGLRTAREIAMSFMPAATVTAAAAR